MSVTQISKIQLRRGRKKQGTGMPQLSSGEMAWAIDTQELFIGNGAISEGAPYVGNTKILTEHDSILELVAQYQYKSDENIIGISKRSVIDRLDEGSVNAKNFGIIPNSAVDQTKKIQDAIYSLYLPVETSISRRVALEFDPGTYNISGTIYIPSNTKLIGSGRDRTIFNFSQGGINHGTAFEVSGTGPSVPGKYIGLTATVFSGTGSGAVFDIEYTGANNNYTSSNLLITVMTSGSNYSENTVLKINGSQLGGTSPANDLTIVLKHKPGNLVFNTTRVLDFVNDQSSRQDKNTVTSAINQPKYITLEGFCINTNSSTVTALHIDNVANSYFSCLLLKGNWTFGNTNTTSALNFIANSYVVSSEKNKFLDVITEGFRYAVNAPGPIQYNQFESCYFKNHEQAIRFGVNSSNFNPRKNSILNCQFENIAQHGIFIENGSGNRSRGNTFVNVGNNGGGAANAIYSVIRFLSKGNSTEQDTFDRSSSLSTSGFEFSYFTEVDGTVYRKETEPNRISLPSTTTAYPAFRLPISETNAVEVNYIFSSKTHNQTRSGKLLITINRDNDQVQLADDYEYFDNTPDSSSADNIIFSAVLEVTSDSELKNLVIYYINKNVSDFNNSLTYTFTSLS